MTDFQATVMAECSKHLIAMWMNEEFPASKRDLAVGASSFLAGVRVGLIGSGKPVDVADTMVDPLVLFLSPLVDRIAAEPRG